MQRTRDIKNPPHQRYCEFCNAPFERTAMNQKYCGKSCSIESGKKCSKEYDKRYYATNLERDREKRKTYRSHYLRPKKFIKNCRYCDKEFRTFNSETIFCSISCAQNKAHKDKPYLTELFRQRVLSAPPFWLGKKATIPMRINQSISAKKRGLHPNFIIACNKTRGHRKGKKMDITSIIQMSNSKRGKPSGRLGQKHSPETLLKISQKLLSMNRVRERSGNWHGGLSFQEYSDEFNNLLKTKTRLRDKVCLICGAPNGSLKVKHSVHHIDYNKKNNSESNLATLCRKHHLETNKNRVYWTKFFQEMLSNKYGYEYDVVRYAVKDSNSCEVLV